jgi:hypothetical protein
MKTIFKTKAQAIKAIKAEAKAAYKVHSLKGSQIKHTSYFCHCGETSGLSLWYKGETFNVGICKSCGDE